MTTDAPHVDRIARFSLTTADAAIAARFYQTAFGCRRISTERVGGSQFERLMGVGGGAERITLGLGDQIVELLQFDGPGAPYPDETLASDLVFQHFAIVVADMRQAYQRLSAVPGWTAISTEGPQRLPASSGGVIAFKFRDPEGHPLELLAFPDDGGSNWSARSHDESCIGIDHSAIVVCDSAASLAYYENLGFRLSARSFNHGVAQQRLDNVPGAKADVIALVPPKHTPHLELLCYRKVQWHLPNRSEQSRKSNDIADTRLVYELGAARDSSKSITTERLIRDMDGHALLLIPSNSSQKFVPNSFKVN